MGTLALSALKPGMRLSADVLDRNGRKLLSYGDTLSEQALRVLKIWGVTEAQVEGEGSEEASALVSEEIPSELYEAARRDTEHRFRHNDSSLLVIQELQKLVTLHLARKMALAQGRGDDPLALVQHDSPAKPAGKCPPPLDVQTLLRDDVKLGSLPSVFHKLVEVVNDSRSSATDVAEVIANDTDLVARLLRVVNSPFYGMTAKVDTISRAVTVVGSNQLVSLAMGISIVASFKGIPEHLVSMRDFWEHSIACGMAARILASYRRMPNTERFFVAGMLHDIGRLIMFKIAPDHSTHLFHTAYSEHRIVQQCEKEVMGFTHDRLGGLLLKAWRCPVSLEKNVRYHHLPGMAPTVPEAAIMCVADVVANAFRFGSSGERLVPVLSRETWDCLELPVSVLGQTVLQLDYQVSEIVRLMNVDG
ncbi:HDOD domain-containing protein [Desulfovibrio mangrovi]|uniref:HDOD domain-containing protein n=1 Tax=Desulfovibrio mangrovi TaxID=2976983 RepID=UPI002247255B|nr:HDOD domain-containing protein [Desulfovibrio mangrovi]UZP67906.1 HDOD domain-containing protein [Desulfovibrio mangrovi]